MAQNTILIPTELAISTTPSPTHHLVVSSDPPIPISHLQQHNQYPSHTNVPINIVQSYAPIFVQPQNQQTDTDIYNDYVNNPYNLTLKPSEENQGQVPVDNSASPTVQKLGAANVFQSANYFGSETAVIPPGSEMLFGKP